MYRRILVPLDGSKLAEQVLPYVQILARGLGCRIELLNVLEAVPGGLVDPAHGIYLDRIAASMHDQARDYLERVASSLREEGLATSCLTREGSPASSIIGEAEKEPATLIAMSTHGRSGPGRWVFGSITDKVLHAASSPLLIIRSQVQEAIRAEVTLDTAIVPLDGSALAEQVLPHVMGLAKALKLKVIFVRVTPTAGEYRRYMEEHLEVEPGPTIIKVYEGPYEEFSEAANAQAMDYLHKAAEKLRKQGAPSLEERLLHGHAAAAIVDMAREVPNNLVAMTTHGRSGVGRWVLGSVTDRVVRYSGDPVLVVRAVAGSPGRS